MQNKKIFLINLIYYICMLVLAVVFVLGYLNMLPSQILSTFLIQGVVMLALPIILYSLFITKNPKQTFKDFGFKKISFTIFLCTILLGFVMYFINNFVADMFFTVLSLFGFDNSINVGLNIGSVGMEFVFTAIVPGFCEEILHRGMYMRGSQKQGYTRYGLLTSSILFGMAHLNIQQFFYAMVLGCLMGVVVIMSDSIFPAMIIHFMNNALSIYFAYGAVYNWPFAKTKLILENAIYSSGLISSVLIIFGIIFLLLYMYYLLIRIIAKSKHKSIALRLAKDLNMENMTYDEIDNKLQEIEIVLNNSTPQAVLSIKNSDKKLKFIDNLFLYATFALSGLITICSFIWGIL